MAPLKILLISILYIAIAFLTGFVLTTDYINSAISLNTDNITFIAFPLFNTDITLSKPDDNKLKFSIPSNQTNTINLNSLNDGQYSVEFSFAIFSFSKNEITIDNTSATLIIDYDKFTNKETGSIEISTNENVTIELKNDINSQLISLNKNENTKLEIKLNEGLNQIELIANDRSNNTTASTISILKDSVPPTIESQIESGEVYGSLIDFAVKVKDASPLLNITINGNKIENNTDELVQTAIKITDGVNIIKVSAIDVAGNINEQELPYNFNIKKPHAVPILMFHHISKDQVESNSLSEYLFEDLLKWIIANHYSTITFHDLNNYLLLDKPIPKKSVILSFDDGYTNNYFNAFRLLKQYSLKGSFGVIPNLVGTSAHNTRWYMNWDEIKEMANAGMEITSHTYTHPYLNKTKDSDLKHELLDSKEEIEQQTGQKVETLIYPSGAYSSKVIEYAKKYCYLSARINGPGPAANFNNLFTLPILRVSWGNSAELIGNKINQISK